MKCIVPLAGPDLKTERWGFRPLVRFEGAPPILEMTLNSRAWRGSLASNDFVFVVRAVDGLEVLTSWLLQTWPGCAIVTLSRLSDGALLSALAGLSLAASDKEPICIDLADILFDGPADFWSDWPDDLGGVVPSFESDDPTYSYLRIEADRVIEAAEKRVISNWASAGVYFFKDTATFLDASAHSLRHREALAFRGNLFVCPALNGVLAQGLSVIAPPVSAVNALSKRFHD